MPMGVELISWISNLVENRTQKIESSIGVTFSLCPCTNGNEAFR